MPKAIKVPSIWGTSEEQVLESLERIDAETEAHRRDLKVRWEKALRLFRKGEAKTTPTDMFRLNIVNANVRRGAAMLTEMKPQIQITPRKDGLGRTAELLTKVIHAIWDESQMQMVLEDLVTIAKIMQSSFCQIVWNPTLHYGLGGLDIRAIDPRLVGVDPGIKHARDLRDSQYIWVDAVVPLYVAQANFPSRAAEIRPSVLDEDTGHGGEMGRGLRRIIEKVTWGREEGKPHAIPRVILRTYWLKDPETDEEGRQLYPNGRVIVTARDQNLILNYDQDGRPGQPSPYYDGEPPIEWLDLAPDIDSPWGLEEVEAVRHLQAAYNRLGDALVLKSLQDSINTWVTDTNAVNRETIDFLRNAGFYVVERAVGRAVEKRPGEMQPPLMISTMAFLHSLMDQVSGVADSSSVTGTRARAEIRSSSMLEGLQLATQVMIRAQARRLEAFLERLGHKLISRIFQFFTDDRVMTYTTPSNDIEQVRFQRRELIKELVELATDEMKKRASAPASSMSVRELTTATGAGSGQQVADTLPENKITADFILKVIKGAWRDFRFQVRPLSSVSLVRAQRAQLAIQLAQAGIIPTRLALVELGYENARELLAEVRDELELKSRLGLQPQQPKTGSRRSSKGS